MGISTDAIVAYGYDLGEELPAWAEDDPDGAHDAILRRLLDTAGFTERPDDGIDGYYTREWAAEEALPVEIVTHCHHEAPMYVLAARGSVLVASRGEPKVLPTLHGPYPRWDRDLRAAAETLRVEPTLPNPTWLLFSFWG